MAYGGIFMDTAAAEIGRNPVSTRFSLSGDYEQADAGRDGRTRLVRPNSQARTNVDRIMFIFPVQLTTSRIGNLTRLALYTVYCTIQK